MQVIASFTGRGIDVHNVVTTSTAVLDGGLIRNLVDGVRTGRVRGFVVQGTGADVIGDIDEALLSGELSLAELDTPRRQRATERYSVPRVNETNALHADGAHEEVEEDWRTDYYAYQARQQRRTDTCPRTGLPSWACECYEYADHLPGGLERFVAGMTERYELVWSSAHQRWYHAPRMWDNWTRMGLEA